MTFMLLQETFSGEPRKVGLELCAFIQDRQMIILTTVSEYDVLVLAVPITESGLMNMETGLC